MVEMICEECGGRFPEKAGRDIAHADWVKTGDRKTDWWCCGGCEDRMKREEPERYRKMTAPTEADLAGE